jgi:hypothetical protein
LDRDTGSALKLKSMLAKRYSSTVTSSSAVTSDHDHAHGDCAHESECMKKIYRLEEECAKLRGVILGIKESVIQEPEQPLPPPPRFHLSPVNAAFVMEQNEPLELSVRSHAHVQPLALNTRTASSGDQEQVEPLALRVRKASEEPEKDEPIALTSADEPRVVDEPLALVTSRRKSRSEESIKRTLVDALTELSRKMQESREQRNRVVEVEDITGRDVSVEMVEVAASKSDDAGNFAELEESLGVAEDVCDDDASLLVEAAEAELDGASLKVSPVFFHPAVHTRMERFKEVGLFA